MFVNHGEDEVCDTFVQHLANDCGLNATSPYSGSVFDLAKNEYEYLAAPVPAEERKAQRADAEQGTAPKKVGKEPRKKPEPTSPYGKLMLALERLTRLLERGEGHANGEIKAVTRLLNDIANDWEQG